MSKLAKALTAAAGNAGESLYVEDVFSTYLYEGTGSGIAINNGIDLSGEGGLVVYRRRDGAENWSYQDTERGVDSVIYSDSTNAAANPGGYGLASFNSNGFTTELNTSGADYASWTFRKAEKFFDVVTYTGNGVNGRQLPHSLGSTPGMVVCKRTDTGQNWILQHKSLDLSGNKTMYLNNTDALAVANDYWNSTHASSTAITLSGDADINGSGGTYVAYVFASDAGGFGDDGSENIIKCGSVTTDGSGNASVDVGFEPQWCLWKCIDAAGGNEHGNWRVNDVMRGWPASSASNAFGSPSSLYANTSGAETNNGVDGFIKSATGFGFGQVQANKTYIYIAIRRPMKTPESGTEVFAPVGATSTAPLWKSSFPVDAGWYRYIIGSGAGTYFGSRLTGTGRLESSSSAAEVTDGSFKWDYMNGWFDNSFDNTNFVGFNFKRATGFMDVVAYSGTGSAHTEAHNLGVVPELIILKGRSGPIAFNWAVYSKSILNTESLFLNYPDGKANINNTYWNSTTPTNTNFSLGSGSGVNASGGEFIAYLFATLAGVSKVGSYTGTGSDLNVDCGFSAGARFILIKRTDATGDWYTYDSFRGIVAGNDPYILMNTGDAQVTNTDYIDPLSSGFTVTSSASSTVNVSSGSYIFLAIA